MSRPVQVVVLVAAVEALLVWALMASGPVPAPGRVVSIDATTLTD